MVSLTGKTTDSFLANWPRKAAITQIIVLMVAFHNFPSPNSLLAHINQIITKISQICAACGLGF